MIVGQFFEGDDDTKIAWKQHDVYREALGIIKQTCNRITLIAKEILDTNSCPEWGTITGCDHRTLQGAHDILAAAWRFRHDSRQGELPIEVNPKRVPIPEPEHIWLDWLQNEVRDWVWHPRLVRNVQLILSNQNQPFGYVAESRLCLALMARFSDVPWDSDWREAYQRDLESGLKKIERLTALPEISDEQG